MKCLDSTFIIDFLRNEKEAVKKATEIEGGDLVTTTISIFEVMLGVNSGVNRDKRFKDFMNFLDNIEILSLDFKSSLKAAEVACDLMKSGNRIEDNDNLIAGTSLANNCNIIITRNKDHFERVKGIKVENY
ncbi:type II toxin-antitoxin system VapC family toxin [Candidatus Woesearchaeota archaeon]|nr:type II toxin-antitoxin system VapC family toxin [Candidatus Woesearchaeota archaeon]